MAETVRDVSVIICAYSEERWDDLVAAVESVQQQTLPPDEIIVVIDYNARLLSQVRENLSGVFAIENSEAKGASGARNSGVAVAQGRVLAFLDDDAVAQPDWIENLVACYTYPHIVGVGGKIEPLWWGSHPSWFPNEFNWVIGCTYQGMPTKNAPVRNVIGANMSVRRHVLTSVGGFRESFGNNKGMSMPRARSRWFCHYAGDEETEFCIRVTQKLPDSVWLYTPSAIIQHRVPVQRTRWTYFLWRCYDEGLGKSTLVGLHGMQAGLSSERTYTFKTLPLGVMRGLTDVLFRRDLTGLARAGAIMVGLTLTIAGYLLGSIFLRAARSRNIIALDEVDKTLSMEKEF